MIDYHGLYSLTAAPTMPPRCGAMTGTQEKKWPPPNVLVKPQPAMAENNLWKIYLKKSSAVNFCPQILVKIAVSNILPRRQIPGRVDGVSDVDSERHPDG